MQIVALTTASMQGFLTFAGIDDVHLLPLPRVRFTFGQAAEMDLAVDLPGVPKYCGSFTWDEARGSWALETDAAARGTVRLNGMPVAQPSLLLEDGAFVSVGTFTLRFDLLPEIPTVGGAPMRVIPLSGETVRIGRGNEEGSATKVALDPEDGGVSLNHATLEREADGSWFIRDHSKAGTELNGQTFERERLVIGDRFRIGHYVFEFTGRSLRRLPTSSAARIAGRHLSRVVGDGRVILNNVSLDVPPGSFVGLLGGSGQGKTTLMTALCGLNAATSGEVLLNGVKLGTFSGENAIAGHIGFVPQDDIVHRELTVREAITFSARLRLANEPPRTEINALVLATAKRLSLEPHLDKRVTQLSGGQRKRVSIATEMLVKPSVLFLDEPSSGLDPATEFHLMSMLRGLAGTDCTVLCTTHVLGFAHLFDRVAFVQSGRLVFYGRPDDAPVFFECAEWVDIYRELDKCGVRGQKDAEEWEKNYEASPVRPVPEQAIQLVHDQGAAPPPPRPAALRALRTLIERQWAILWADKLNISFLMAQAVAIAGLIGWVAESVELRMFLVLISVLWFGCGNAAQKIVEELPIFFRERMSGLGTHPYVLSKLLFISLVTTIQATLLLVMMIGTALVSHPPDAKLDDLDRHSEAKKEMSRYVLPGSENELSLIGRIQVWRKTLELDPAITGPPRDDFEPVVADGAAAAHTPNTKVMKEGVPEKWRGFLSLLALLFDLKYNIIRELTPELDIDVDASQRPGWFSVLLHCLGMRLAAIGLAAVVGVAMGLAVSSLVRTPTQAVMWVPLLMIPQILLGGVVVKLGEMSGPVRAFSSLMPSFAGERINQVSLIYGQAVPRVTNQTKVPNFVQADEEVVQFRDSSGKLTGAEERYDQMSSFNNAWQSLGVSLTRVGERKMEMKRVSNGFEPVKIVDKSIREDIRPLYQKKNSVFVETHFAGVAAAEMGAWLVGSYLICFIALKRKRSS